MEEFNFRDAVLTAIIGGIIMMGIITENFSIKCLIAELKLRRDVQNLKRFQNSVRVPSSKTVRKYF